MKRLELTPEEHKILHELLKTSQARLDIEIVHTDHFEFKQMLKQRRDIVTRLLDRVEPPVEVAP